MMHQLSPGLGPFITRISLGVMLIAHSLYLKLFIFTLPGTAMFFESIGLPGWGAYATFALEAVAGAALIIGYQVRLAAALMVPILLGATWAHAQNGWLFTNENGGWEYPLFLAVIALAQVFLGPGEFVVNAIRAPKTAEPADLAH